MTTYYLRAWRGYRGYELMRRRPCLMCRYTPTFVLVEDRPEQAS